MSAVSPLTALIVEIAAAVVSALVAIILHEVAHGWTAAALGDDTARRAGRLSLNPLKHVDRVGTILVPGILLLGQLATLGRIAFMFGWAKPVPVSAASFRDPRRGMMIVAAAGPAMNFCLAWLGGLALHATGWLSGGWMTGDWATVLGNACTLFILYNLALGLFNLLPLPPLDGGRIVVGLLPLRLAMIWARTERVGILVVLGLVFVLPMILRQGGIAFDPVHDLLGRVLPAAFSLVLRLSGVPDDAI